VLRPLRRQHFEAAERRGAWIKAPASAGEAVSSALREATYREQAGLVTKGANTGSRPMKRLLLIASTAVMLGIGARPSAAVVLYPWCVQYGSIASGTLSCGFTSFQQCLATASGNGSNCIANPQYPKYPPSPRYAPPIRR
jgi:Protein of unknown function (DUF3551)